jgi:hypothetical protein
LYCFVVWTFLEKHLNANILNGHIKPNIKSTRMWRSIYRLPYHIVQINFTKKYLMAITEPGETIGESYSRFFLTGLMQEVNMKHFFVNS